MPNEVVINIQTRKNKFLLYLPFIIIFIFLAGAAFGIGYFVGASTERQVAVPSNQSPNKPDWLVLGAKEYSIEYPKKWDVKTHKEGSPIGAVITGDGGSVEFWLNTDREPKFSEEQRKNLASEKSSEIKVDDRVGIIKEFAFKSGDFFLTVTISSTDKKPKVLFWAVAKNEEFKKTMLEIVSSFDSDKTLEK